MSPFWILLKLDGGGGDNFTGAIRRAKLQLNHHHQHTNTQYVYGPDAFLSPNQQWRSIEGKSLWNNKKEMQTILDFAATWADEDGGGDNWNSGSK